MIVFRGSSVLVLALSVGVLTTTACEETNNAGTGDSAAQAPGSGGQGGAGFSQPGGTGGVVPSTGGAGGQPAVVDNGTAGSTTGGAEGTVGSDAGTNPGRDASSVILDSGLAFVDGQGTTHDGGGVGGTGGTGGTGGIGGIPNTCTEPESTVCNNGSGSHCGYSYEYWKDRGTGCLTNKSDGFSVEWSNINNLLGRKGLRPGSMNQIVTYDADYRPNGNSYLCVYGWTQEPLIEYYIVDSWGSWRPPGGEGHMGTVSSDGGTYDIYRTQRVNQPSIQGTATFYQYWSVRTEKRTSGTITVANHFDAWQNRGMNMGGLYEVSMCVEGYQSSGTADVSVSMR